jgi:hypothetical protein
MKILLEIATLQITGKNSAIESACIDLSQQLETILPQPSLIEKTKIINHHLSSENIPASLYVHFSQLNGLAERFMGMIEEYLLASNESGRFVVSFLPENGNLQKADLQFPKE